MRITPLMIGEAILAALLAICCLYTLSSGSYQRRTGSSWRSARNAMRLEEPQNAVEALEEFLKINPNHPNVRLELAGLYLSANKTTEAVGHLDVVAKDDSSEIEGGPKARDRLRALAEVMLGMIDGQAGSQVFAKDRKQSEKKFALAKAHFEAAIKLENPAGLELKPRKPVSDGAGKKKSPAAKVTRPKFVAFGDACAGLGLIALWQGDFERAERRFEQALSGKSVLGKDVGADVYNGLGVALAGSKKNAAKAAAMFKVANYYRPKWATPGKNRNAVRRSMAGAKEMAKKDRAVFLKEIVKANKKPGYETCNTLGCGYYRLGDLDAAIRFLGAAVSKDPRRDIAQLNLLAVRWEVLQGTKAAFLKEYNKLFARPQGDPLERFWRTPVRMQGKGKKKYTSSQLGPYKLVRGAHNTAQEEWLLTIASVLDNVQELPADLGAALSHIRLRLVPLIGLRLSRSRDTRIRARGKKLLASYQPLLKAAVERFPKDHRFLRLRGIDLLRAGDYPGALAALEASAKIRAGQKDIEGVRAIFAPKPAVAFFRPISPPLAGKSAVLARSVRPLVGAVFRVHNGPVQLSGKNAVLRVDGDQVKAAFWGSELIYRPENALKDGVHAVEAEATDLLGRKVSSKMELMIDSSLPEIYKTEPEDGGRVSNRRPKLVVYYRDSGSGIDPTSIKVELRSYRGASRYFQKFVVMGGRYAFEYRDAARGIDIKEGARVGADKLVLVPHVRLGTGTYMMTITVGDVRGLKATKSFKFVVTK